MTHKYTRWQALKVAVVRTNEHDAYLVESCGFGLGIYWLRFVVGLYLRLRSPVVDEE